MSRQFRVVTINLDTGQVISTGEWVDLSVPNTWLSYLKHEIEPRYPRLRHVGQWRDIPDTEGESAK